MFGGVNAGLGLAIFWFAYRDRDATESRGRSRTHYVDAEIPSAVPRIRQKGMIIAKTSNARAGLGNSVWPVNHKTEYVA